MPLTMGKPALHVSISHIIRVGSKIKMIGIDTVLDITGMKAIHSFWNGTFRYLVSKPVGPYSFLAYADYEFAIAIASLRSGINPTTIVIYSHFFVESFDRFGPHFKLD